MPPSTTCRVALIASALTAQARAAGEPPVDIEVLISDRAACVSVESVLQRVSARVPNVRQAGAGANLSIAVTTTVASNGQVTARVDFLRAGGIVASRSVQANSCDQAADAIALIAAMALASTTATATPETSPATLPETSPGTTTPGTSSASLPDPTSKTAPEPAAPAGTAFAEVGVENFARWSFGPLVRGALGITPEWTPGAGAYLAARFPAAAPWLPSVVLSGHHSWRTGVQEPGGRASFQLDGGGIDACLLGVGLGPVEGRLCATGFVGRLVAQGSKTRNSPGPVIRPFATVGAALLVTLPLGTRWEAAVKASSDVTLFRDSFEFADSVFHTVAPLTGAIELRAGMRFDD